VTDSVAIAFADRRSSRTAPTKRIPLRGKVLIRRCASPLSKQAPADFVTWKARAAADLKRYDRELADIFQVQDEITSSVIGSVGPQILVAEAARVRQAANRVRVTGQLIDTTLGNHLWADPGHLSRHSVSLQIRRSCPGGRRRRPRPNRASGSG
jgi:hypothetical protein